MNAQIQLMRSLLVLMRDVRGHIDPTNQAFLHMSHAIESVERACIQEQQDHEGQGQE